MLVASTHAPESVSPSAPVAESPPRRDEVASLTVSPLLFNQLAQGTLSAVVVPQSLPTPEGMNLLVVNARHPHETVSLEIGRSQSAQGEPGLEPGYKAVSLHPQTMPEAAPITRAPSFALAEASLKGRSFMVKYAIGRIHGEPLFNGGTVHMRDDKGQDTPTRVAVLMRGDMAGIASGYELVTLPQRPRAAMLPA